MHNESAVADDRVVSTDQSRIAFADNLLRAATRPERIAAVIARIVGDRIETGPIALGPGGLLLATASGRAEHIQVIPSETDCCEMSVRVPVTLSIEAGLGGISARYLAAACVRTRIALVPHAPCSLHVQHQRVSQQDVVTKVRAQNAAARLADLFLPMDSMVADRVVTYLNTLLTSPRVLELSRIDVADLIERAWDTGLVIDRQSW